MPSAMSGSKGEDMRTYKTAFPCFTDEMPIFEGFEDTSWKNDACPSFQFPLGGGSFLRVWVDYADPSQRDCPELERFAVDLIHDEDGSDTATVLQTDDLDLVRFVCGLIQKGQNAKVPCFLCKWGDLYEFHTEETLRRDYGETNLYEADLPWADGEQDFQEVLKKLKAGIYSWNNCDNMEIFTISKGVL